MNAEDRREQGIDLAVTDAQAETLVRLRDALREPKARFASQTRPDGSRAVVDPRGRTLVASIDVAGYRVDFVDGKRERAGALYDPA